jgi:hypothetical protein
MASPSLSPPKGFPDEATLHALIEDTPELLRRAAGRRLATVRPPQGDRKGRPYGRGGQCPLRAPARGRSEPLLRQAWRLVPAPIRPAGRGLSVTVGVGQGPLDFINRDRYVAVRAFGRGDRVPVELFRPFVAEVVAGEAPTPPYSPR